MSKQIALNIDSNYQRRTHISRGLKSLGLELHNASAVDVAETMLRKNYYHLVLMHVDTLGREIFRFCSFIRSGNSQAILIALMANIKTGTEEKLFDCGVNDVVSGKQISPRVLTKRIRSHLRNGKSLWPASNTIRLGNTIVDFKQREVWCNGVMHPLRGNLTDLLKYFVNNPNRVISREELRQSPIWADSICSSSKEGGKTFDVSVGKLRRIIELNPQRPKLIKSVRGIGWKLVTGYVKNSYEHEKIQRCET